MNDETATFWEHMDDLRRAFVSAITVIAIGFALSLFFYQDILTFVTAPFNDSSYHRKEVLRERVENPSEYELAYSVPGDFNRLLSLSPGGQAISDKTYLIAPHGHVEFERLKDGKTLVMLSPLEGMMASVKICFWVGLVISSPLWIFFLLKYLLPALQQQERRAVAPVVGIALIFMVMGFLFAYFVTIPLANQYLLSFNNGIGENLWSLSNYLDYTLFLMLANAFAFELSLILLILVHYRILNADAMAAKRRHMIVVAFILGAILTPPDVLTQFMLAIPLIILYELAILYARFRGSKKASVLQIS